MSTVDDLVILAYIHTQKNLGLGIKFVYLPIPNIQTRNCIFYPKMVCIEYGYWVSYQNQYLIPNTQFFG